MTAEILIGEQPVKMCGNAATPIRFKQVFHQDLLMNFKGMTTDEFDTDMLKQLAYIMSAQAEGADFRALTFETFVEWMSQFEEMDFLEKVGEIINLWMKSSATSVKNRKN